jgi:hypothetical protein
MLAPVSSETGKFAKFFRIKLVGLSNVADAPSSVQWYTWDEHGMPSHQDTRGSAPRSHRQLSRLHLMAPGFVFYQNSNRLPVFCLISP